ncbi:MAG: mRNA surveillance protein pelota [Candidatus Micrarchaeota archaeon]|nr:mRNA surveillance protein pelota [Candidatus Micrarchaeota archaeon]
MKVIRYSEGTGTLKLVPGSFDDLYLLARVIGSGDRVTATTYRRFRPNEGDVGEQKEVVIELLVEKVEIDKNAQKLRLMGKIISGRPMEYVKLGGYHTTTVGEGDAITIWKEEWKAYVLGMIKKAVADSRKPRLGVVAVDDEKATFAYVRGYGIDIVTELYSKLSKRLKQKDFEQARDAYFDGMAKKIAGMQVDVVVIAGPGFMKDDFKRYVENKRIELGKKVAYTSASDAERSGIREAIQSDSVSRLLENEKVKKEFALLNEFLAGLNVGASYSGVEKITNALAQYEVGTILVNDSVLNDPEIKAVLDSAYVQKVEIEVFNSDDDAGSQLRNFHGIAAIGKSFMKKEAAGRS